MIFFSLLSITNNAMSCSYASCFQKSVPSSTGNLWRRLGRLWKCEISAKCKVILSDIHWLSMDHHFKCTKLTWSAHDLKELDTIDGLISDPKHIVGNLIYSIIVFAWSSNYEHQQLFELLHLFNDRTMIASGNMKILPVVRKKWAHFF